MNMKAYMNMITLWTMWVIVQWVHVLGINTLYTRTASVRSLWYVLDWLHVVVLYWRELQRGDGEEPARVLQELLKWEIKPRTVHNQDGANWCGYRHDLVCQQKWLSLLAEVNVGVKKAVHRTNIVAAVKSQYTPSSLASLFSSSVNMWRHYWCTHPCTPQHSVPV